MQFGCACVNVVESLLVARESILGPGDGPRGDHCIFSWRRPLADEVAGTASGGMSCW
jgi:hypothetical protein